MPPAKKPQKRPAKKAPTPARAAATKPSGKSKAKSSRPRATKKPDQLALVSTTDFQEAYSEDSFWTKVKDYGKAAGSAVLRLALMMYYSGKDAETPLWARTTIMGALGYFISPIDAIPDFTPVLGYSDDLGVLTAAVAVVAAHITPAHKRRATLKLREWFE